jgi:hypothetical protein
MSSKKMKLALLFVMCCSAAAAPPFAAAPGSYSEGGVFKACEAGTYSPSADATSCLKCAEGSISGPGSSACTKCAAGMVWVSATRCDVCPNGQYTKVSGAKECLKCAAGYGGSRTQGPLASRGQDCSPCPQRSTSLEGRKCILCPAGSYGNMVGGATCTKCPVRTASAVIGATSKSTCVTCKNQPRVGFTPAGSAVCVR